MVDAWPVLVVAGLLVVMSLAWIGQPLWRGDIPEDPPDPRAVALLAEREAVLAAIDDLDEALFGGRLDPLEHAAARAEEVVRGARILAAIDALETDGGAPAAAQPSPAQPAADKLESAFDRPMASEDA